VENSFFRLSMHALVAMMPRWRFFALFFRPVFSASRVQQVSDMHSKFVRPHYVRKYGRHPISDRRRGKKDRRKKIEITGQKYNGLPYYIGRPQQPGRQLVHRKLLDVTSNACEIFLNWRNSVVILTNITNQIHNKCCCNSTHKM